MSKCPFYLSLFLISVGLVDTVRYEMFKGREQRESEREREEREREREKGGRRR